MLLGSLAKLHEILAAAGTRPSLNTSFVECLNLTLRCGLLALTRRSPCIAKTKRTLQCRLNLFLLYYNVVRLHFTIETTPAHRAGLTDHAWQWEEVLQLRLPPERQFQLVGLRDGRAYRWEVARLQTHSTIAKLLRDSQRRSKTHCADWTRLRLPLAGL